MGIFQLCIIGAMLVTLWALTKIMIAIVDLLVKLMTIAIVMAIALMLFTTLVMHTKPG